MSCLNILLHSDNAKLPLSLSRIWSAGCLSFSTCMFSCTGWPSVVHSSQLEDKVLIIHLLCSPTQNLLLNGLFLKALIGTMETLHWCQVFELIKQAIWAHHPREGYYCSWLNLTAAHQSSVIPIILCLQLLLSDTQINSNRFVTSTGKPLCKIWYILGNQLVSIICHIVYHNNSKHFNHGFL